MHNVRKHVSKALNDTLAARERIASELRELAYADISECECEWRTSCLRAERDNADAIIASLQNVLARIPA